jgi:serine phosphatase RsbU (regulator of sigma subunit)
MTKTCENRWRKSVDFLSRHLSETRHFNSWLSRFIETQHCFDYSTCKHLPPSLLRKAAEIFDIPLS